MQNVVLTVNITTKGVLHAVLYSQDGAWPLPLVRIIHGCGPSYEMHHQMPPKEIKLVLLI